MWDTSYHINPLFLPARTRTVKRQKPIHLLLGVPRWFGTLLRYGQDAPEGSENGACRLPGEVVEFGHGHGSGSSEWRMKRLALPLLFGLLALAGCSTQYVIKLTNGAEITTPSKPKRQGGAYVFKDAKGEQRMIPAGRVREIEPASMAKQENKPKAGPSVAPPHKRHWYLLWLG